MISPDTSPASASYRETEADADETDGEQPSDLTEITITPNLKSAFLSCLESYKIHLRFFSGPWDAFVPALDGEPSYDLVLTSETIYRSESLPSLLDLLQKSCGVLPLDALVTSKLSLDQTKATTTTTTATCLVAAKVLYFGVGGGVSDFISAVNSRGGKVETVWENKGGVGRKIMKIDWIV